VFCSPPYEAPAVLPAFRQWAAKQHLGYLQITIPEDLEVQIRESERIEPLDNLELDLDQSLNAIWKGLGQQKSAVRKAIRSGVRIHFRTAPDFLRTQDDLLAATYERQKLHPNFPRSLYRTILETRDQNGFRLLSATHQGKTIASIWTVSDASRCYYWDAASLPKARDLNANHLLVWCLIRWAHRNSLHTLDFVGGSVGGRGGSRPGIGRFKQSMGGRPVQYRILYRFSPLTRAAFFGYRWLNHLRLGLPGRNRHASSP
jgi:lipid II:glycine glycyltransferase (peptidoglycan interpeptide bridge formation enzyme)